MDPLSAPAMKVVTTLFGRTGVHRLLCPVFMGRGVILVLHRVLPPIAGPRIAANARIEITPDFLEELILFFRSIGYRIISLDEVHDLLLQGQGRQPFVCFTFDDGYVDALEVIAPIFRKHGAPWAVYLTTSFPDRKVIPWWYMLEDLVLNNDSVRFRWQGNDYLFATTDPAAEETAFLTIRQLILATAQPRLADILRAVFADYVIRAEEYNTLQLTWDQVVTLARDPLVTIGAHTVHHFNLRQLSSEMVRQEILESKKAIEQRTGRAVHHFAYPFGSRQEVSRREVSIADACGFKTMTTVNEGNIFAEHRNHLACLPRVEVTGRYQDLVLIDMRRCGMVSLLRHGLRRVVTL